MRYHALATDYDGTIATHGDVTPKTIQALRELQQSGRKLILVTGRELPDLFNVFPHPELFDRIVAENGALLYRPETKEERTLSEPPPPAFVDLLRQRGVSPLSVGHGIVATTEPNETQVLQAIRELGLELQVIFNKGAVMVLPSGVNKATGLREALKELHLSQHNVVGVGDAENDHAFLEFCECAAAVANALPALKDRADIVLRSTHGEGVVELIQGLLQDDLAPAAPKLMRHEISIGLDLEGTEIKIAPCGLNLLIAGEPGPERSRWGCRIIEELLEKRYQTCILSPHGDCADLEQAMVLGDSQRPPSLEDLLQALDQAQDNVVATLVGLQKQDWPMYFERLLPRLLDLRQRTGRPHRTVFPEVEMFHAKPDCRRNGWPDLIGSSLVMGKRIPMPSSPAWSRRQTWL
ncbi:MAG: HAD-IIB family hydrolase [Verrucomicrobiota bacterium]